MFSQNCCAAVTISEEPTESKNIISYHHLVTLNSLSTWKSPKVQIISIPSPEKGYLLLPSMYYKFACHWVAFGLLEKKMKGLQPTPIVPEVREPALWFNGRALGYKSGGRAFEPGLR
ncbi:hypothetical protein PPYR_11574 [Photinus pyralis]|uniref:Uncharacterized protein n=1 Tax=Photinus pyralis TaxID=7054 RepID=A0A5N4ABM9_PHOPY|nr:hypothetical protein PPYR_11574 [Photinus pyralis]